MRVFNIPLHEDLLKINKEDIVTQYLVHTTTIPSKRGSDEILILKEQILTKDNQLLPNFKVIVNPMSFYYLVKPQYRTYKYKKEREHISRLDMFKCENRYKIYEIARQLGIYSKRISAKQIINNPYVYGADIDIASIYKMYYKDKNIKHPPYKVKRIFLDIEKDTKTEEINVMSFTYNKVCYSFTNKQYMHKYDKITNKKIELTEEDIKKKTYELIGDLLDEHGYTMKFFFPDNEKELLIQVFSYLHSFDVDFVTIWNMDYDVPQIEQSAIQQNIQPIHLFCEPKLPNEYKIYKYYRDGMSRDHYVLKWHWLTAPARFQWIDSMTLHAWNRRTQPYEDRYTLDYILEKYAKLRKLFIIDDHATFQRYRFDEYVGYNAIDTIAFNIKDDKTKDIQRMYDLSRIFDIKDYGFRTRRSRNSLFYFYRKKNQITGSVFGKYELPYEQEMRKAGGAVLTSQNAIFINNNIIKEDPFIETLISTNCADFDYESLYPNLMVALKISRDNMVYAALNIKGFSQLDVYDYFSKMILINENIMELSKKYYNLPDYIETYNIVRNLID